ncbi:hypothetical protein V5T82_16905 [Magnetovibrio sp. PR-2]|uniref:hypothetical protein n=1 Tax=Magnetovibrio sp. PR-2 TaxID=3120356 RepID=UPI002FCDEC7F
MQNESNEFIAKQPKNLDAHEQIGAEEIGHETVTDGAVPESQFQRVLGWGYAGASFVFAGVLWFVDEASVPVVTFGFIGFILLIFAAVKIKGFLSDPASIPYKYDQVEKWIIIAFERLRLELGNKTLGTLIVLAVLAPFILSL